MEIDLNMLGEEISSLDTCDVCELEERRVCDCSGAVLNLAKIKKSASELRIILGQKYSEEQVEFKLTELFNKRLQHIDIFECEYCPRYSQQEDMMCKNEECYIEQAKMFLKFIGEPYDELILEEL